MTARGSKMRGQSQCLGVGLPVGIGLLLQIR
jgi:hypothetical protein